MSLTFAPVHAVTSPPQEALCHPDSASLASPTPQPLMLCSAILAQADNPLANPRPLWPLFPLPMPLIIKAVSHSSGLSSSVISSEVSLSTLPTGGLLAYSHSCNPSYFLPSMCVCLSDAPTRCKLQQCKDPSVLFPAASHCLIQWPEQSRHTIKRHLLTE